MNTIVKYNSQWAILFNCIKLELNAVLLDYQPSIEHIGSTSVRGLAAKPVIDVLVGMNGTDEMEELSEKLMQHGYVYFQKYNERTPYRRFFVKLGQSPQSLNVNRIYKRNDEVPDVIWTQRMAHIHVVDKNSIHWIRHIAFREYLKYHRLIRKQYETVKLHISRLNWLDAEVYKTAKDTFIRQIEDKAVAWYKYSI